MKRTALRATGKVVFVALVAAAWTADASSAKRPVTAPGAEPPPPPVVEAPKKPDPAPPTAPDSGAAVIEQVAAPKDGPAPAPPAVPSAFKDERAPNAAVAPRAVDPDPRELRYRKKTGDVLVAMAVRPGKPKAGTPTEIVFELQELLPIPDPALGDRRPVEKAQLVAKVTGPDGARTFELHPLAAKGEYGFHFTPAAIGLYTIVCDRSSGRPGLRTEFALGVGVETPIPTDRDTDPALRKGSRGSRSVLGAEPRSEAGPDDTNAAGVMNELGHYWLTLRRTIGTPDAAAPMAQALEQARKLAGKTPASFPEGRATFDRLAEMFVAELEALRGRVTDPAAAAEFDRMQAATCLRCHAQFRFGIAENVERWPDFEKRESPPVQPAAGQKDTKRKLPIAVPGKE